MTLRETIVDALKEGFDDAFQYADVHDDHTDVYTTYCDEPIRVEPLDVVIPDGYENHVVDGIRMDVRAILVMNEDGTL